MKDIDRRNAAEKANNGTAVFGINWMSDLSPEEFKSRFLGSALPKDSDRLLAEVAEVAEFKGESTSVDWRGILTTPLKYQEGCGTCW